MRGDDLLAEPLEREGPQGGDEPLEALPEGLEETGVARIEPLWKRSLEALEERPLGRRTPQQHKCVVRDADQRRCEHGDERLVVVAVVQQPQVGEQVGDLLLPEVAAAGRSIGRQAKLAQLLLVPLGVRPGREEEHDLARLRGAGVDELFDPARDRARLAAAPVRPRAGVACLVGHE